MTARRESELDGRAAAGWSATPVERFLDHVRDAVVVLDADDCIRYGNPPLLERLDSTLGDVAGRSFYDVMPALRRTVLAGEIARVRRDGRSVTIDEFVPMLAGWYAVDLHPMDGDVALFIREVTEIRRNEWQRQMVRRVDTALTDAVTLSDALRATVMVIGHDLGFDVGEAWMVDRVVRTPRLLFVEPIPGGGDVDSFCLSTGYTPRAPDAPPGRSMTELALVATPDVTTDPSFVRKAEASAVGLRCALHLGLDLGSGRLVSIGWLRCSTLDGDDSAVLISRLHAHLTTVLSRLAARIDLEQFFDLTTELISIAGFDGSIQRVNPALARAVGRTPDELVGRYFAEWVHPDDLPPPAHTLDQSAAGTEPGQRTENRIRQADGQYRWVSWRSHRFTDEGLVYSTGIDVTEDRADRVFREGQNDVLRAIVEGEPLEATMHRLVQLIEAVNDGALASVLRFDETSGTMHTIAAASLPDAFSDAIDGQPIGPDAGSCGTAVYERRTVVVADIANDPLWTGSREVAAAAGLASCWSVPIVRADGRVFGTFAVYRRTVGGPDESEQETVNDVVHLAGIAVQRSLSQAQLTRSEERFRLLADVITDAIWDWDLVSGLRWRSDGFCTMFGYPVEEMDQSDQWWVSCLHPDDRDAVVDARQRALIGDGERWTADFRFRRADGSYAEVTMRGRIVRDDAGRAVRMIGGMSDVTERRLLEQQYLRAQRVESLGTLAGGIAHDLNNSLAPIVMAVDLLQDSALDDELADTVDVIASSARRSAEMVRKILTFARGIDGERSVVRVNDVVHDAVRIVRDVFPKDIEIVVEATANDLAVYGDATQLHQVLVNLALNARDAMPNGGRIVIGVDDVQVGVDQLLASATELSPGRYARISVTDTGTGIATPVVDRLFEPFFTTKARAEGTGLGLPTSLAIARSHGGDLVVTTTVGAGSTFAVVLPVSTDTVATGRAAGEERPLRPDLDLAGGGATVLVVDDEDTIRAITRDTLESSGYRVLDAEDGQAALDLFDEHGDEIDVICTDIMMPGMDGPAFVTELRRRGSTVPVLAMTGLDDTQRAGTLAASGVAIVIPKPFDRLTLLTALHDVL